MGIGKIIKKAVKNAINPAALLGPNFQMAEAARRTYNDEQKEKQQKANEREERVQKAEEAEKNEFLNGLDEKRRRNRKSNVVFAGLLGGNGSVGLGGRKSLLGL